MSEIVHPPIDLGLLPTNNLHQTFVQEAAILVMDCSIELEEIIANKLVTTQATERVDMDSTTSDMIVALRLRTLPVLECVSLDLTSCQPSDKFSVVAMEHASFDSYEDELDDDELDWKPYVLAVMDAVELENAQVLSASSGRPLQDSELFTAQLLLTRLREELRVERYEESDLIRFLGTGVRPVPNGQDYVEFDEAEFMDINPCTDPCANEQAGCSHSPYSLN